MLNATAITFVHFRAIMILVHPGYEQKSCLGSFKGALVALCVVAVSDQFLRLNHDFPCFAPGSNVNVICIDINFGTCLCVSLLSINFLIASFMAPDPQQKSQTENTCTLASCLWLGMMPIELFFRMLVILEVLELRILDRA